MKEPSLSIHNIVFIFNIRTAAAPKARRLAKWKARLSSGPRRRAIDEALTKAFISRAETLPCVNVRRYPNFTVVQRGKKSFTLFSASGHCNSSGTRRFDRVQDTVRLFNLIFNARLRVEDIKVVNTTASGQCTPPSATAIHSAARGSTAFACRLSLRPHFFPGIVIRRSGQPTCILFSTGKFVILGALSELQARETLHYVHTSLQSNHSGHTH